MQIERIVTDGIHLAEERKQDISSSVLGAVCGVYHPNRTPLRLHVEHSGTVFADADPDNKVLRRGRWCEPAIAKAVKESHPEWRIEPANVYLRFPELRLGGHPDFFLYDDPRGLGVMEGKTASNKAYEGAYDGGRQVPDWILLQTLNNMMLADARFGVIAVLLVDAFNMDIAIHEIPRNPEAEEKIRAAVKQFWHNVDNGIEPQPDFARDAETIRALLPKETPGKIIDLSGNNVVPVLLDERAALSDVIKESGDRRDAIDAEIKFLMGDAEIATGIPGWRLTFKSTDRAGYTVAPKTVRSLRVTDQREKEPTT